MQHWLSLSQAIGLGCALGLSARWQWEMQNVATGNLRSRSPLWKRLIGCAVSLLVLFVSILAAKNDTWIGRNNFLFVTYGACISLIVVMIFVRRPKSPRGPRRYR